jgi:hypothetical protein
MEYLIVFCYDTSSEPDMVYIGSPKKWITKQEFLATRLMVLSKKIPKHLYNKLLI